MQLPIRSLLLALLLALSAYSVYGQVTAGFTASPMSGCAPLVVSFFNTSTPVAGTTYVWNMGNGSGPITLTNPSTSYFAAGTYTVTLTATNGSLSNSFSRVITVNPVPVVSFSASDTAMCPGVPVTFTNTTTGGVPGPVTYLWSSGDGYTSTGTTYVHAYALPGYFNVSLSATNAAGCSSVLTKNSYIHIWAPPTPVFTGTPKHVCHHAGIVTFTATPVGLGPFTYKWSFGDGSPIATSSPASHYYASPGSYAVKLVVTDSRGCMDSATKPAYIDVGNLTASYTGLDSACAYNTVTFTNTSSPHISTKWFFGDGHSSASETGVNTYIVRGAYTVTLVVADSFCTDTFRKSFIVPAPNISFHITPDTPCPPPFLATFNGTVPAGSTVKWFFGDGSIGAGNPATHIYNISDFDTVVMVTTNAIGCKDTASYVYKIYDLIFGVHRPFPDRGCVPFTTTMGADYNTSEPNLSFPLPYPYPGTFVWDYGDGTPNGTGQYTTHTYTSIGIFPVKVTVLTQQGCNFIRRDTVMVGTHTSATFTATPLHQCYNNNLIKFTRTLISGPIDSVYYYWKFGDWLYSSLGFYDTAKLAVYTIPHRFTLPGKFSDTLISIYNGCETEFVRTDYITIDSPMAQASARAICPQVRFINFSLGDDTHKWLFGDGTADSSSADTVYHIFSVPAIYTNKLITYNIASGCRDTATVSVDMRQAVLNVTASDTVLCPGDTTFFNAKLISGPPLVRCDWYVGSAYHGMTDLPHPYLRDIFHTPGRFTIKVAVTDQNGCPSDTITKTNYILVAKPDAHVTAAPVSPCWPQVTVYTDVSTDQPGVTILNHIWAFGDGSVGVATSPSIVHSFSATGIYSVLEIVTDNVGCKDTVKFNDTFYNTKAAFIPSTTQTCANTLVGFTNTTSTSTGVTPKYMWSFGDGGTSTLGSPYHIYADSGHYTVRLVSLEAHGCTDTALKVITVSKPHAAFYMPDSVSVCPPFNAHFINTSSGAASSYWILGDGNTSIATSPSNLYTVPGYDTVKLIVTNSFGCKDTAVRHVKIYGYAGAFSYPVDSGCVPFPVFFNADLTNISIASSIIWDFSDGVVSPASLADTITHRYLTPGAYLPKLIITDHAGCVSSSMGKDTIRVDGIRPGFIANPDPVCLGDSTVLTDTAHSFWSHITSWSWTYNGTTNTNPHPVITYTAIGIYPILMQVTDAWGCTAVAADTVSVYAIPKITANSDTIICEGATINLSDSMAGGRWSSNNPVVATVGSVSGIVSGISFGPVIITYGFGPTCFTTRAIVVDTFPNAGIIVGDTGLCVGATIVLTDAVTGGLWVCSNNNATITPIGIGSSTLTAITAGMDTVIYTITNIICSSSSIKPIVIYPLPDSGIISGPDSVCKDGVITLTESVQDGKWSSANTSIATIDSITGLTKGIGFGGVIISYAIPPDSNGCINYRTFPLQVINADFTINKVITPLKCKGGADGSIALIINGGTPPFEYKWSNDSTSASISGLVAATYTVSVLSTINQCSISEQYDVISPDSIRVVADINNDVCYNPNGSIKLAITGGTEPYKYQWSNKAITNEIHGLKAGKYDCMVTDVNGCVASISIVLIDTACPEIIIYNGITPNGDGINDTWVITGLQHYPDNVAQVYDKWGDLIFEQANYQSDWYGISRKGYLVPDGTYYYLLKLNSSNPPHGKDAYTGSLLIKR